MIDKEIVTMMNRITSEFDYIDIDEQPFTWIVTNEHNGSVWTKTSDNKWLCTSNKRYKIYRNTNYEVEVIYDEDGKVAKKIEEVKGIHTRDLYYKDSKRFMEITYDGKTISDVKLYDDNYDRKLSKFDNGLSRTLLLKLPNYLKKIGENTHKDRMLDIVYYIGDRLITKYKDLVLLWYQYSESSDTILLEKALYGISVFYNKELVNIMRYFLFMEPSVDKMTPESEEIFRYITSIIMWYKIVNLKNEDFVTRRMKIYDPLLNGTFEDFTYVWRFNDINDKEPRRKEIVDMFSSILIRNGAI